MRSFAVIAGFAAAANAAYYPVESSSSPAYPAETSSSVEYPSYEAKTSSAAYPAYPAATSSAAYPAYPVKSSSAAYPAYPVSSSSAEYPAYSSAPAYSSYPAYTTTKVVTGLTTVCPEPTTVTYGSKTYTVSSSTTLVDNDCEYTTTYVVKPTPSAVKTPVYSAPAPPKVSSAAWYPSANGTAPAGTAKPTSGKPSSTKPATPEFTGAAGKATAGFLAVAAGAVAAFL